MRAACARLSYELCMPAHQYSGNNEVITLIIDARESFSLRSTSAFRATIFATLDSNARIFWGGAPIISGCQAGGAGGRPVGRLPPRI